MQEPQYWELSPGQILEAGVPVTLAPGTSDGNLGDEVRAFADDRVHANGSRPGRVSERCGE